LSSSASLVRAVSGRSFLVVCMDPSFEVGTMPGRMNRSRKNSARRFAPFGAALLAFVHLGSSDCFPTSNPDAGGYVGPGSPSVEVTVDGVHVGPAPTAS